MGFSLRGIRHRITIQREETTADGAGGFSVAWVDFVKSDAAIKTSGSREVFFARQLQPASTHAVRLRYRPGITTAMRISYRGRVFQIRGVIDIGERHEELMLACEEAPIVATAAAR